MTEYTHRFRMIVGKENVDPGVTVQAESTEAGSAYAELVATVAALADDEHVDLDDERFQEIISGVGKTADDFIADCIARRDTN